MQAIEYTIQDAIREIGNPERWNEASIRNHLKQCQLGDVPESGTLTDRQVASVKTIANREKAPKQGQLKPVTDDDVLDLAESKGFDLDELMQAAVTYRFHEDLVTYVEELQSERRRLAISRAAKVQAQSEDLEERNKELLTRLDTAVNSDAPNFDAIRTALGVQNSGGVQKMAKAQSGQKDFLSLARKATGAKK